MLKSILKKMCLIVFVVGLSACSTTSTIIGKPQNIYKQVNVGDEVIIDTKDDKHYSITVTEVTPTYIIGGSNKIATKNIDLIKVKEVDIQETGYVLYGVATVALVLFFMNEYNDFGD